MRITLSFKARDIHELACHHVAAFAGLYAQRGLDVRLSDPHAPQAARAEDLTVACGAAAMRWLAGERISVVFVATARPMFWLWTRRATTDVEDLRGKCVATYPSPAPPAHFLRIALEDAGLVPGTDVALEAAADDRARLALLLEQRADAALISSATSPARLEEPGLVALHCLGDSIRLPTTGLAVTDGALKRCGNAVDALRDCLQDALSLVHSDERLAGGALEAAGLIDELDADTALRLLRAHLTRDGLIEPGEADTGIRRLAAALGLEMPGDPSALYSRAYRRAGVAAS